MGSRSKGGYKVPENNTGRHFLGRPVRLLVLALGRRHPKKRKLKNPWR